MEPIKFKGKTYLYVKSVTTQLSDEYVPDWGLFHALRESIQNMVDETVITNVEFHHQPEHDGDGVYFYDRGRGVDFKDILYLGISGKRGVDGVVGQHGEGEVVSSMVAARLDIEKIMASQTWLATSHLEEDGKYRLLVINLFETDKPRKGTAWYFKGDNVYAEYLKAQREFRPPSQKTKRLITSKRGQMYTQGLKVNEISNLQFGYDLKATPGRDRSGFVLDDIKDEATKILSENAGVDEIAKLLERMLDAWWQPEEAKWELDIDPGIVKKAAKRVGSKQGLVWTQIGGSDGPYMADAMARGFKVLKFRAPPPKWVSNNILHVRAAVKAQVEETKPPPRQLANCLNLLQELLETEYTINCVYRFKEDDTIACANGSDQSITVSRYFIKRETFVDLVKTIIHEVAHLKSGSADCTRLHTSSVSSIHSKMSWYLATEEARRDIYTAALKAFKNYKGNQ